MAKAGLLALDVGTTETGWVLIDKDTHEPKMRGVTDNKKLFDLIDTWDIQGIADEMALERLDPRGMPIGETTLTTVLWAGRFEGLAIRMGWRTHQVRRRHVKSHLCGTQRAKDSNISQSLWDKYAPDTGNRGKGTKDNPGWFYGFKSHIWQAYAAGVTYLDLKDENGDFPW